MKFLKISLGASMFFLSAIFFMFSSCEKTDITTNDTEVVSFEYFNRLQNSSPSASTSAYVGTDASLGEDASVEGENIVYLEIPEEYLAEPGQEVVLLSDDGPFYTEDGEEVEGIIMMETTVEGGTFFTIGVSQNLLDLGLINPDLYSHNKPWVDYYIECLVARCYPPNSAINLCKFLCKVSALEDYLFQN